MLKIWEERTVFPASFVAGLLAAKEKEPETTVTTPEISTPPHTPPPNYTEPNEMAVESEEKPIEIEPLQSPHETITVQQPNLEEMIQLLQQINQTQKQLEEAKHKVSQIIPPKTEDLAPARAGTLDSRTLATQLENECLHYEQLIQLLKAHVFKRSRLQILFEAFVQQESTEAPNSLKLLEQCQQSLQSHRIIEQKLKQRLETVPQPTLKRPPSGDNNEESVKRQKLEASPSNDAT